MELNSNSIIDHFLLLGIDNETQKQTKINSITVLATITSNSSEKINEEQIISIIFPKNDSLFKYRLVFTYNSNNNRRYYCFAYVFMDKMQNALGTKAFCILSQYPLFSFFNNFAQSVEKSIHSENLKFPIEVLIYNYINYISPSMCEDIQYEFDSEYDLCFNNSVLFDSNHDDFLIIDEKGILNDNKKKVMISKIYRQTFFDFYICEFE